MDRWRLETHRARTVVLSLAAMVFLSASAYAQSRPVFVGPGQEVLIDLSGDPDDMNDSALRLKNLSQNTGQVTVDFIPGPQTSDSNEPFVQDGFALIDGTLRVQSDIPPGELLARYLLEYRPSALRRADIRPRSARMMRRHVRSARWIRAVNAIRHPPRRPPGSPTRNLRDTRPDFELGHHGFLSEKRYVWAVVDVNSDYAVGGAIPAEVPVLASILLIAMGSGIGLLGIRSLRRAI